MGFRKKGYQSLRCLYLNLVLLMVSPIQILHAEDFKLVAKIGKMIGKVQVQRSGKRAEASQGMILLPKDIIITGVNSATRIDFVDGGRQAVGAESQLSLENLVVQTDGDRTSLIGVYNLIEGKTRFLFKPHQNKDFSKIKTNNAVLGIRGTDLSVKKHKDNRTDVLVYEGKVTASNASHPDKSVDILPNQATVVQKDLPPVKPFEVDSKALKKEEFSEVVPESVERQMEEQTPPSQSPLTLQLGAHAIGFTNFSRSTSERKWPGEGVSFQLGLNSNELSSRFLGFVTFGEARSPDSGSGPGGYQNPTHRLELSAAGLGFGLTLPLTRRWWLVPQLGLGIGGWKARENGSPNHSQQNDSNPARVAIGAQSSESPPQERVPEDEGKIRGALRLGVQVEWKIWEFLGVGFQYHSLRFGGPERRKWVELGAVLQLHLF